MNYYGITLSDPYLSHHGIKGQKWGVRRFQNEDGSLTSSGEKRYGSAKENYKQAKKDFNRSYGKAYNYSSTHAIRQIVSKKSKDESNRRWEKASNDANKYMDAQREYKSAKAALKAEKYTEKANKLYEKARSGNGGVISGFNLDRAASASARAQVLNDKSKNIANGNKANYFNNIASASKGQNKIYERANKDASYAKTKNEQKRINMNAYNTKQTQKYGDSMSKAKSGQRFFERTFGTKWQNTEIKTIGGRTSTIGKEATLSVLTLGYGGAVADAAYNAKKKKSE